MTSSKPATEDQKASARTGRYRKVEVRTWGDEKFRALTPIPPCGQGLWLFLITGPHTGPIPGLFRAGRAAMAEELGWEIEDFDRAFQEASERGMVKADFRARFVWIPNAIRHNRPESPNVVRSWASEFDLLPECSLKQEALEALKASVHALGEPFARAFDEALGKALLKPFSKAMPNQEQHRHQEQEQEQERDQKQVAGSLAAQGGAGEPAAPTPPVGRKKAAEPNVNPKPAAPKASKRVPGTWLVSVELQQWARENVPGIDIRSETEAFRDFEFSRGHIDWDATWRTWMRNALKRGTSAGASRVPAPLRDRSAARAMAFGRNPAGAPPAQEVIDV